MTTRQQYKLLAAVSEFTNKNGFPPSYKELGEAIGVGTKSGINRIVVLLEQQGLLIRGQGGARNLIVVDTPRSQAGKIQRDMVLSAMLRKIDDLEPKVSEYDMDRIERLIFNMMKEDLPDVAFHEKETGTTETTDSTEDDYSEC